MTKPGTDDVLRNRLAAQAHGLARRAEELNAERLAAFGSTELRLVGAERLRTEQPCVPRDIVQFGGLLLFGGTNRVLTAYEQPQPSSSVAETTPATDEGRPPRPKAQNKHSERQPDNNRQRVSQTEAKAKAEAALTDPQFLSDLEELYRYYRDSRLLQLRVVNGKLLAVFQTGLEAEFDYRVLRWNGLGYEDNLGEPDHVFPPSHDFEWIEATRDDQVDMHLAIGDVSVDTGGGLLTIRRGGTVFTEPVAEPLQSLADSDVYYAEAGPLTLLRIRPYKEEIWRYLVVKPDGVVRLDGIGQACRRLPEDHGIVFPGGYCLADGTARTFDLEVAGLEYERVIRSANGEDVLYVFHERADGRYLLLPYNLIRKEAAAPIACHGYALFDDGALVVLKADPEPSKTHPLQIWQTPFVADEALPAGTGPLDRIGNADLVRAISDCLSIARMTDPAMLIAACHRAFDRYHWLAEQALRPHLEAVLETAEQVLAEAEKVEILTIQAAAALEEAAGEIAALVRAVRGDVPRSADAWVAALAGFRLAQGRLLTLREVRYLDAVRLDALSAELDRELLTTAQRAADFLQGAEAFAGYLVEVSALADRAAGISTVAQARPVGERIDAQVAGLEVITEVTAGLDLPDATVRTEILERIGEVLGGVNRARAILESRRRGLAAVEGRAAYAAEFTLLGQAVSGALAVADSPARCDEQLGRLLLQIETLEARFAEFDDFLQELNGKREDVYEAFSGRKQALLDERTRRADRLVDSAARILTGIGRRAAALGSLEEVNAYFAADPMVAKLRTVAAELSELGDPVRAAELQGRVKAVRQEAGRSLRDRLDLFEGQVIKLGRHRFTVNTEPADLTMVPSGGQMAFAVTGTDYRSPVLDPAFEHTRPFWSRTLVSESAEVYRGEHLAASVLVSGGGVDDVRKAAAERYDEGYERGVHDHDAAAILEVLARLHTGAGLLRYPPAARAAAQLFWAHGADDAARRRWTTRAASLVRARAAFGPAPALDALAAELTEAVHDFGDRGGEWGTGAPIPPALTGEYLVEQLAVGSGFVTSKAAVGLVEAFHRALGDQRGCYEADLLALDGLATRQQLVEAWLSSYLGSQEQADPRDLPEAVALELCPALPRQDSSAALTGTAEGLLGTHPRIKEGRLELRLDEALTRTREFREVTVPAFRAYQRQRNALVTQERKRLRLAEFTPSVLSGFVRNKLIDEVYLPLIGDNLARQLGETDQMGLLLLISPPGYGKTTLMEYVAARLGLVLVKVNGPALGSRVTSLDPAEAPGATARQEVEKISFALEMGSNVLLYLDDIQHTSPELLQKFSSLCDAQRRIEGVWEGRTKTYDLRGKRFAVCMAGNPYTESGQRFRIPDMLANRADVWNLGDVLSGREELFALSYVENALTANPVLAPLSARDRGDVELLVRQANSEVGAERLRRTESPWAFRPMETEGEAAGSLSHPYSSVELDQVLSVLRKLVRAQQVVLACNQAYIASAAQSEESRTEPPFLLQGSYRNLNKLAARIVPVMNDAELEAVIDDHYRGEAQTLGSAAEGNLLKLKELRGTLSAAEADRWAAIKTAFLAESRPQNAIY